MNSSRFSSGSFTIKKISDITGEVEAAASNYCDGTAWFILREKFRRCLLQEAILHLEDHGDTILIICSN